MKKVFLVTLAVILVSGLILSGCAQPAPAPAPVPAPAPSPAEPIKIRWVLPVPPMAIFNGGMLIPWSEMIHERTAAIGKPVELVFFYGESLTKADEELTALLAGVMDGCSMLNVEQFVPGGGIVGVMHMPLLFNNTMTTAQTVMEMYEKYPEFQDFYSDIKLMWFQPTGPANVVVSTKKPIKTLEDFKGLRTWAEGRYGVELADALGSVAVDIPIIDVYISLERGGLDYVAKDWEALMAFKWFEITKYRSEMPRGFQSGSLVSGMNWDSWNKLPPDVQAIFEELNGRFMTEFIATNFDNAAAGLRGVITGIDGEKGNPPVHQVPQDEFQRWVEAAQPVYDSWLADMEADGLPGRAVFEDVCQLADKYAQ